MPHRTIKAPIHHLRRIADLYLPEELREKYVKDCMARATLDRDFYIMNQCDFEVLRKRWRPHMRAITRDGKAIPVPKVAPSVPIPRKAWPDWVKNFADAHASDDDKGFGDTVERTIGKCGSDAFKKWYLLVTGKKCGCGARKDKWNAIYPYIIAA
jgi:hypothetical protein